MFLFVCHFIIFVIITFFSLSIMKERDKSFVYLRCVPNFLDIRDHFPHEDVYVILSWFISIIARFRNWMYVPFTLSWFFFITYLLSVEKTSKIRHLPWIFVIMCNKNTKSVVGVSNDLVSCRVISIKSLFLMIFVYFCRL